MAEAAVAAAPAADAGNTVEEVFVTAQRRSEPLQKVPVAVSAVQGDSIRALGVNTSEVISTVVPGLNFNVTSSAATVYLRGVGQNVGQPGVENPTALYVDNVYQPSTKSNVFELNDIQRIEVLRGPQGTLFGRNASGGVINIITKDPSHDSSGEVSAGYANFNTVSGALYATRGITDTLAADIALVGHDQQEGWGHDPTLGGRDVYKSWSVLARTKWLWTPIAGTRVTFIGNFRQSKDNGTIATTVPGTIGVGGVTNLGFYNTGANAYPYAYKAKYDGSIQVEQDLPFGMKLVDIAAYQDFRSHDTIDSDDTALPLLNFFARDVQQTTTNEIHLLSPEGGKLTWIVGAFFMRDLLTSKVTETGTRIPAAFGTFFNINGNQGTTSYAAFAQATYKIRDDTRVTAGIRYTQDRRSIDGIETGSTANVVTALGHHQWDRATYRLAVDHDFTDTIMGYVSYNTGFKSGAYNVYSPPAPFVNPEELTAYSAGVKSEWFGRSLRLNVEGFYYDYRNEQLKQIVGGAFLLANAASAHIGGVDVDFEWRPQHNLVFSGGFEALDPHYASFPGSLITKPNPAGGNTQSFGNVSGNQMIQVAKFSGNLNVTYSSDTRFGQVVYAANYKHSNKYFWDPDDRLAQGPTDVVNGSIKWTPTGKPYNVRLWMENITDEKYETNGTGTALSGDVYAAAAPRTYGVTFAYSW